MESTFEDKLVYSTLMDREDEAGLDLVQDLVHLGTNNLAGGNKWRKLQYSIEKYKQGRYEGIVTFGGAYSNHLVACAAVCAHLHIPLTAIVRGERPPQTGATLRYLEKVGVNCVFVSREEYREKHSKEYAYGLREAFGNVLIIPEGGASFEGVQGCVDLGKALEKNYSHITCPLGTGTTVSGLLMGTEEVQILGFPALKQQGYLRDEVRKHLYLSTFDYDLADEYLERLTLIEGYHFGGFGKCPPELIVFLQDFYKQHGIKLDPVYTGKMMYGVYDLFKQGDFKADDRVLAVHTGGLQGIQGMEERLGLELYN